MIETIGWIGSSCLAVCALPQVLKTWRTGKSDDLSWGFLWLWFVGEIFLIIYMILSDISLDEYHFPLYFNYTANILMVVYLGYKKGKRK